MKASCRHLPSVARCVLGGCVGAADDKGRSGLQGLGRDAAV